MEDKKSKKTSWTYALGNHILEANFPDGSSATFDLTVVIPSIQVGFFNLPSPKLLIIEELDNKIRASPYRGGRQCLPIFSFS